MVRAKGETTTVELAQAINAKRSTKPFVSLNSCTNSLMLLVGFGLVSREEHRNQQGRVFFYRATTITTSDLSKRQLL